MRWRALGLLALLLALAVVGYYALERKGAPSGSDATRLFHAEEKDVETIAIQKGDALIVLKREGDGWALVEPVHATADDSEVASLLHILLDAKEERRIDETPRRLADYGLEQPAIELSVTLKGGKMLQTLLLGDVNPNGRSVYAKRPDQPAVFLASVIIRVRSDRKPDDFRDKTVLALEPNQITQVELAGKGQPITLNRSEGTGWEISRPIQARADPAVIGQLLWTIKDARATGFADSGPDAKRRYGLEHPDLIVVLKDASGAKRLLLKKAADRKIGLYAKAEPGEDVMTLDAQLLADLSKSPSELLDRSKPGSPPAPSSR